MRFSKSKKNIQWDKYMVYIIFVVVFVLFALILGNKGFLQPRNLVNILRQTAMISVMAVAGVFVMAAGQIFRYGCGGRFRHGSWPDRSDGRIDHSYDGNACFSGPAEI